MLWGFARKCGGVGYSAGWGERRYKVREIFRRTVLPLRPVRERQDGQMRARGTAGFVRPLGAVGVARGYLVFSGSGDFKFWIVAAEYSRHAADSHWAGRAVFLAGPV